MGDPRPLGGRLPETWSRTAVQRWLEDLVAANRFTIAVVFPVVGAALLVGSALGVVPEPLAFNPLAILFGTFVMRLPLVAALGPLVDRRSGLALAAVAGYAYAVEFVGVTTGWPYGEFAYGVDLGPMIAGHVPLGLPLFFLPLVCNAYLLVVALFGDVAGQRAVRLPAVVATVLAIDLVLDPAAVAIGFWDYGGGAYYGVPWTNFRGWVLSATVAVLVVDAGFDATSIRRRLRTCRFALDDLVSFVVLWGVVNLLYGHWIPVVVSAVFVGALVRVDRFGFAVPAPFGPGSPGDR